jgi:hypothetical protein
MVMKTSGLQKESEAKILAFERLTSLKGYLSLSSQMIELTFNQNQQHYKLVL